MTNMIEIKTNVQSMSGRAQSRPIRPLDSARGYTMH